MTNEELKRMTIKLFGKSCNQIKENEIDIINRYINKNINLKLRYKEIITKLYYNLSINNDKGCWLPKDWSYYGKINGRPAHRLSYKIFKGSISLPCICHHCDRPGCRNPFHLFQGTHSDNIQDARKKGRLFQISLETNEIKKLKELDKWKNLTIFCK